MKRMPAILAKLFLYVALIITSVNTIWFNHFRMDSGTIVILMWLLPPIIIMIFLEMFVAKTYVEKIVLLVLSGMSLLFSNYVLVSLISSEGHDVESIGWSLISIVIVMYSSCLFVILFSGVMSLVRRYRTKT
jgi:hypothetical protein